MIADAPSVAGGELRDAPPELLACISPESSQPHPGRGPCARHGRRQRELTRVRVRLRLRSRPLHRTGASLCRARRGPVAGGLPRDSGGRVEALQLPER